jgi:hypothetical protein
LFVYVPRRCPTPSLLPAPFLFDEREGATLAYSAEYREILLIGLVPEDGQRMAAFVTRVSGVSDDLDQGSYRAAT